LPFNLPAGKYYIQETKSLHHIGQTAISIRLK
jgi:hypothetical protein